MKFSLNPDELTLLSDPAFFIRKRLITERIVSLFGALEADYAGIAGAYTDKLPPALLNRRGKISRGENYRGLPYILLDFPAIFEKKGVFAFRTLMWWGNPFSFTFHLSGCYLDQYLSAFLPALESFDKETFICINTDQWQHHHEATNYMAVSKFTDTSYNNPKFFSDRGFLKISKLVSLEEHEKVTQTGLTFLKEILDKLH